MPYAIELYLDANAENAVRSLWQRIAESGAASPMIAAGYRPHVSLGVCEDLDVDRFCSVLTTFARSLSPFDLILSSLGMFTSPEGVLFFGATVDHTLLDVHEQFNRIIRPYTSGLRSYYCTDRWVPHCTLAFGLDDDDLIRAARVCIDAALPMRSTVRQIGVSEVTPKSCTALFEIGTGEPAA